MILESDGRKHPVHWPAAETFNTPVIVFLTAVTKNRKPILANDAAHKAVIEAWASAKKWLIGRYVLMPDHLHLFCAPNTQPTEPLLPWVADWKSQSARTWSCPEDKPVWQRHFWDTQLRRAKATMRGDYVKANPVRAGLVSRAEDWPYQGELNELRW